MFNARAETVALRLAFQSEVARRPRKGGERVPASAGGSGVRTARSCPKAGRAWAEATAANPGGQCSTGRRKASSEGRRADLQTMRMDDDLERWWLGDLSRGASSHRLGHYRHKVSRFHH
jgi:hypothetical protein